MNDRASLEAFCRSRLSRVVGLLSLYCGDRDVAEGLAQDTMAVVCRDWHKLSKVRSPDAWVNRVALNLANSYFRRRRAERRMTQRVAALRLPPDEWDAADAVAVRKAVAGLPTRQRTALVLRYYADLPIDETAEVMDCAPGTVKALTHKALIRLRAAGLGTGPKEVVEGG